MKKVICLLIMLSTFLSIGYTENSENAAFMQPWPLEEVNSVLDKVEDFHPFPTYSERETWEKIKKITYFTESLDRVVERARELKEEELSNLPASLYLDFQRTGRRGPYQMLLGKRSTFLSSFALAKCIEGAGEFLDPLMDTIWAYCEESDWCLPAHTSGLADMNQRYIDLRASSVAATLAQLDYVFNDALPEAVIKRIRYELETRIFTPYLNRDDFFWLTRTHNWNAVCNSNIMRAALFIVDDQDKLAQIITKAQNSMCRYLTGFGRDGGTAEGIGYWNYGFSNYVDAAYLLNIYSQEQLNMFDPPIVREIALFPTRVELSPGRFPSFSDGRERNSFSPGLLNFLGDYFNEPDLQNMASYYMDDTVNVSSLDSLFTNYCMGSLPEKEAEFHHPEFVFLHGVQWMISRTSPDDPDGLVLAAKGGSNHEPHNHNDMGNFIVHYRGESLIPDLGAPVYDRGFFSGKRYSYLAARSLGHSVPRINGLEQMAGSQAEAVAETSHTKEKDVLTSDITSAYPSEAGLEKLERKAILYRDLGEGWIEIVDYATFSQTPDSFESVLMTFGEIEDVQEGQIIIHGKKGKLRVEYDPELIELDIRAFDTKEANLRISSLYPVTRRIAFQVKNPKKEIELSLKIYPF